MESTRDLSVKEPVLLTIWTDRGDIGHIGHSGHVGKHPISVSIDDTINFKISLISSMQIQNFVKGDMPNERKSDHHDGQHVNCSVQGLY